MKTLFLSLSLIICFLTLQAQSQLTIGKAFDLHTGDSLRYDHYFWTMCEPYPGYQTICTIDDPSEGFVIDSRQDYIDSVIYHVHLGTDTGTIIINDLDSSLSHFNGLAGSFLVTNAGSFLNAMRNNGDCTQFIKCDSNSLSCHVDTSVSVVNGGWLVNYNVEDFESGGGYSLLEKCGLFQRGFSSITGCFNNNQGGDIDKLIYYKTDSTVWLDSSFYFNGIKNVNPSLQNTLSLYPNPATDKLTLSGYPTTAKEIEVNNLLGQTIFVQSIQSSQSVIDLSSLTGGIYFAIVKNKEGNIAAKKFVKE